MTRKTSNDEADRFASGTGAGTTPTAGTTDTGVSNIDDVNPGATRGSGTQLPDAGRASDASSAEGTIGAVGEMDFTGAPAGTSGASSVSGAGSTGETYGGGPGGGGAMSMGGTGPGTAPDDPGPQSIESTLAVLGDNERPTPGG